MKKILAAFVFLMIIFPAYAECSWHEEYFMCTEDIKFDYNVTDEQLERLFNSTEQDPYKDDPEPFSIVVVGDTGDYVYHPTLSDLWHMPLVTLKSVLFRYGNYKELESVSDWIVRNKDEYNIKAAMFVGDLTANAGDHEFRKIDSVQEDIRDGGIPVFNTRGNHDCVDDWGGYSQWQYYDKWIGEWNPCAIEGMFIVIDMPWSYDVDEMKSSAMQTASTIQQFPGLMPIVLTHASIYQNKSTTIWFDSYINTLLLSSPSGIILSGHTVGGVFHLSIKTRIPSGNGTWHIIKNDYQSDYRQDGVIGLIEVYPDAGMMYYFEVYTGRDGVPDLKFVIYLDYGVVIDVIH